MTEPNRGFGSPTDRNPRSDWRVESFGGLPPVRCSDAAYECGAIAEAAALARECGESFFLALAPRLEVPDAEVHWKA
jgi:hypothetical protein